MKIKILIILIIMGLCYNIAFIFSFEKIYPETEKILFSCEVIREKEEKDYYDKYIVKVLENKNLKKSKNTRLILYVKKDKQFIPGDILLVQGNFEKGEVSRNYKGFNYRNYLKQNKIYGIVFGEEIQKTSQRKDFYYVFFKIRIFLEDRINKLYENDYASFLKGLLIGNKSQLDEEIVEDFKNANISHILAISGLHISYILVGVNFILEKIINSKKIRDYILIFFLIFFLLLTGSSVSCMRACIMNIFAILCSIFYKRNNFYISLIISLFSIIILNPYNIFSVGMWLSYFGTLGIVFIYDFLYKMLCMSFKLKKKTVKSENTEKDNYLKRIINNFKRFILKSFSLSISAQIFIIPIMLYVFNTFSLTFFISNIITSIFIDYVLAIGYISIFISFIVFPFSKFISYFEECMIYVIFKTADIVSKIPFSPIYITTPSIIYIIIYYFVLFGIIIYFKRHKFYILKTLFYNKKTILNFIRKDNIYNIRNITFFIKNIVTIVRNVLINLSKLVKKNKILKSIFIIIIIISLITNINRFNFNLQIYFVDVGQGDCTLIITPFGKRILIDGGEGNSDKYDYGKKVLFPYLLDRGIRKIDYLVISHADSDHIGGLIYILENMKVNNILIGIQSETSKQLESLIKIANSKKIKIEILGKEDIIRVEKNTMIEVLWPNRNNIISENTLNNNSLVFKLRYNNFSILFTGDIEEVAEKAIMENYSKNPKKLKSTVLKVAHHGSKSSSTQEFLNYVSPQVALIGVGKNNNFGHPNNEVINRLEKMRY